MAEFLTDVQTQRANARAHIDQGHADDLLNLLEGMSAPAEPAGA
jgi:hypothetical protein